MKKRNCSGDTATPRSSLPVTRTVPSGEVMATLALTVALLRAGTVTVLGMVTPLATMFSIAVRLFVERLVTEMARGKFAIWAAVIW